MAVVGLTSLLSTALETSKFLVECHSFVAAEDNILQDYAYHLNTFGYLEEVANGINIDLDEGNVVLSVDIKQSQEEEYSALSAAL